MAVRVLAICALSVIARGTSTCLETKYLVSGTCPIPDEYLTASSEYLHENGSVRSYGPLRSRLNTKEIGIGSFLAGAWSAKTNDDQQWIQARFLERSYITGIVTQGRNHFTSCCISCCQRITSYQFYVSENCEKFVPINEPNGDIKIFPGNTDQDSHVTNMLPNPVRALCVRIKPVTWVGHVSLRFDVLGCSCGSILCSVNCTNCNCGSCTNCVDDYYPSDMNCMPCENKNCLECSNSMYCLSCKRGLYGPSCQYNCSEHCLNTICQVKTGHCFDCVKSIYYGPICNESCSINCLHNECDKTTGYCTRGCVGDHFGKKCQFTCPKYCQRNGTNNSCSNDGTCRYGCAENHHGSVCDQKCSPYCAISSNIRVCSMDGSCLNGCVADHYGSKCEHICPTNCTPVDNGTRCDDQGVCVAGYARDKCESSINKSDESLKVYKSGMIASLTVAVLAIVIIAVMICLLLKKRLITNDVVNSSVSDRSGPAEPHQRYTEICIEYNALDKQTEEAEPYAFINSGHT